MSLDRLAYKIECVSALAGTGCQYGPDAFAPKPAAFTAHALGNIAIYDNKPNRLFSEIIGQLNTRCRDKLEIGIAVSTKTIGQILGTRSKFRNLLFKFGNASKIKLFCFGSQNSASSFPTGLFLDKFWALLEKNTDMPP